jgi:glutamate-ammonia-ligase adenylyltransferase
VISKKTYKFSTEFVKKLTDQTAGIIPPDIFDKIIGLFESEATSCFFTFNSESNLLRIISAMYDKSTLLLECIKFPHHVEILISIATNSNYLTDILVRNPEYFYWIVNPSTLDYKIDQVSFISQVQKTVLPFKSFHAKVNSLRSLKRKEVLRIGVKDIFQKKPLEEITGELSVLAKSITSVLFELCYSEILNKYSIQNPAQKNCLIALGKLGGNELNYSSDIDLIVFFDVNSELPNKKTYGEILIEAVHLFIESASSITGSGFLYRVDFRLRPDGKTSFLSREMNDYLNYYESRGEDWERQMLIKMDFVAGSFSLFESFASYLKPFIYPLSFSTSPVEQIKKLKSDIEKKLGNDENIKLIPGGIRDIEFSVQALQLLNGGKNKHLRTPNTITAIKNLCSEHLLTDIEASDLLNAYILYRRIEHYLQLMNDSQTHIIPKEGELLHKLSSFLGFDNVSAFQHTIVENRKKVLKIYNSIMGITAVHGKKQDKIIEINFKNKTQAKSNLQFLREGTGLLGQRLFDKGSINNFGEIEPELIRYLHKSSNPDKVLQNFVRIIRGNMLPSIWYKEFINIKFFDVFLQLCEFSQMSIDLFAEDEDLREYFLTKKVMERVRKEDLGNFSTKKLLFVESVKFTLETDSTTKVLETLKNFFNQLIATAAQKILNPEVKETEYAIAAMGSLGSGETTFASDIDLIFIVNDLDSSPEIHKNFQSLFLRLQELFKPLEIDCRLRPEGKSSPLVWDLQGYKNYIATRLRSWELQSFCKLNFIAGNKNIFKQLLSSINRKLEQLDKVSLKRDVLEMRQKLYPKYSPSLQKSFNLKKSSGGITDIEFLIQYILLSNKAYFSLCRGKRIDQAVILLSKNSGFSHTSGYPQNNLLPLLENFLFLKKLELVNQVVFNSTSSTITLNEEKMSIFAQRMNFSSMNEFQKHFLKITKQNKFIFEKFLSTDKEARGWPKSSTDY